MFVDARITIGVERDGFIGSVSISENIDLHADIPKQVNAAILDWIDRRDRIFGHSYKVCVPAWVMSYGNGGVYYEMRGEIEDGKRICGFGPTRHRKDNVSIKASGASLQG
jgi:hypothetical protein